MDNYQKLSSFYYVSKIQFLNQFHQLNLISGKKYDLFIYIILLNLPFFFLKNLKENIKVLIKKIVINFV